MKFQYDLAERIGLCPKEIQLLASFDTPERFQDYIRDKKYAYQDVFQSFRVACQAEDINCFGGAMMGAAYVMLHGLGPPLMLCMEAGDGDSDHNIAVYWQDGRVGSLTASRHVELTGKPACFKSYEELVLSYYPDYRNCVGGSHTLRGYSAPIDLSIFRDSWLLSETNLKEIESYLYAVPYRKLFPNDVDIYAGTILACDDFYYAPRSMEGHAGQPVQLHR